MTATTVLASTSQSSPGVLTRPASAPAQSPKGGHVTQWVTASPLWGELEEDPAAMRRPALLRFASDQFMEELTGLLQSTQPGALSATVARPVSYRARPTGAAATWTPSPPSQLKLYQPVHGHFNLVAASLVCRAVGLPDRALDLGAGERVGFVLRRLDAAGRELAWIKETPANTGWQSLSGLAATLAPNEELLPLFPLTFQQDGRRRRLLVGLVPTSSQETFQAAPALTPLADAGSAAALADRQGVDPRLEEVEGRVVDSLTELLAQRGKPVSMTENEVDASLFLLLDLADWFNTHLPAFWQAILTSTRPTQAAARDLYDLLAGEAAQGSASWLQALQAVWNQRMRIAGEAQPPTSLSYNLKQTTLVPTTLAARLSAVLTTTPAPAIPADTAVTAVAVPKFDPRPGVQYCVRCVYLRPACTPWQAPLLSEPSQPFAIAPFFDFDAPSRPVRITLPVDTSIAGLRKFNKNVAFQISDKLRAQLNSVVDMKKALDGDLASGSSFNLGEICSFSIPIITICALVVLLMFIFLLNIVFWWVPFFRICLPLNLKAKG